MKNWKIKNDFFEESMAKAKSSFAGLLNMHTLFTIIQNGVPQGSVLSLTLFALKINDIINQIPKDPNFHYSLYEDDHQIGYHHMDINVIQRALQ